MESVISPSEIHKLDPRAIMFGWTPEKRFVLMESVPISRNVPEHVHRLIVTSKNLIIHSCHYYPFNVTAMQAAFSALELAINLRAEAEGKTAVFRGLRDAMDHAVRNSWISDVGLPIPQIPKALQITPRGELEEIDSPVLRQYVEVLAKFMPKIRNALAHGSSYMNSNGANRVLMINHLVNQLFPEL
ncbi:hypothetical protein HSX11_18715 [Oxalobacteraceae bacterium]|nr:hypothetical protein [Oxalobacteraceae bacterium]